MKLQIYQIAMQKLTKLFWREKLRAIVAMILLWTASQSLASGHYILRAWTTTEYRDRYVLVIDEDEHGNEIKRWWALWDTLVINKYYIAYNSCDEEEQELPFKKWQEAIQQGYYNDD
jgi:hypothetical protein